MSSSCDWKLMDQSKKSIVREKSRAEVEQPSVSIPARELTLLFNVTADPCLE
jgi:hypothetical protein